MNMQKNSTSLVTSALYMQRRRWGNPILFSSFFDSVSLYFFGDVISSSPTDLHTLLALREVPYFFPLFGINGIASKLKDISGKRLGKEKEGEKR